MDGKQLNNRMKQVGMVLLLLSLLVMFVRELSFFMSSILGSFTLYILLRKPYFCLIRRWKWNSLVANLFLIGIAVFALLIFGGVIFGTGFIKLKDFSPHVIVDTVTRFQTLLIEKTGYNIFSKEITLKVAQWMSSLLPGIFNLTNSVLSNLVMMIFILFFLLKGGRKMEVHLEKMLPLSPKSTALLKKETNSIVIANAVGIPMIIIIQAAFACLGYWFFGIKSPVVWGALTGLFGIVPILGTTIIWFPLSLFLILNGEVGMGIGLMAYCFVIITNIDNVFRMLFMGKYANVHPLITVFGIILGLKLFGFWGIIFGPLLIAGFLILLKIYRLEFLEEEKSKPS